MPNAFEQPTALPDVPLDKLDDDTAEKYFGVTATQHRREMEQLRHQAEAASMELQVVAEAAQMLLDGDLTIQEYAEEVHDLTDSYGEMTLDKL